MTFLCACVLCCASIGARSANYVSTERQTAHDTQAPAGLAAQQSGSQALNDLEQEVIANLKQEVVGTATLADLNLPDEFLKRVAGRILRASFEENFRIVVPDEKPPEEKNEPTKAPGSKAGSNDDSKPAGGVASNLATNEGASSGALRERTSSTAPEQMSTIEKVGVIVAALAACGVAIVLGVRYARRRGAQAR